MAQLKITFFKSRLAARISVSVDNLPVTVDFAV